MTFEYFSQKGYKIRDDSISVKVTCKFVGVNNERGIVHKRFLLSIFCAFLFSMFSAFIFPNKQGAKSLKFLDKELVQRGFRLKNINFPARQRRLSSKGPGKWPPCSPGPNHESKELTIALATINKVFDEEDSDIPPFSP